MPFVSLQYALIFTKALTLKNFDMRAVKTTTQQNTSNPDFNFQDLIDQLELDVMMHANSGKNIHHILEELEAEKISAIRKINGEARKIKTPLERQLDRCKVKLNETKEDRIAQKMAQLEPEKDAAIAKIRKRTLDKNIALNKKKESLESTIEKKKVERDFILRHHHKGLYPTRYWLYDYTYGYVALLVGFGFLDWNFSRNALSAYGGFDRAAAAIIALAMGIALCICTHYFGESYQQKNKFRKMAFGITGAILCIFIIVLRIKY